MKAEEFINICTKLGSNEVKGGGWNNGEWNPIYQPWVSPEDALEAIRLAREEVKEQMIDKAIEWLKSNIGNRE